MAPELYETRKLLLDRFREKNRRNDEGGLYYLRRRGGARTIHNEDEVAKSLSSIGFKIIDIDTFTLEDHVRLWSGARVVVAPTGAVLTNMIWCRPSTSIVCLISDHVAMNPYFWQQIADLCKVKILYFVGKRQGKVTGTFAIHDDFSISSSELIESVRKIL